MPLNDILVKEATQFVDIALGFVGILILYYVYRVFTVGNEPRDDSELHGRQEAAGRWVRERRERAEHQAGAERRRRLLEPARGFLIRALGLMEHLRDDDLRVQSAAAVREARDHAESAERQIRSAIRVIRAARAGARGDLRNNIMGLSDACQATLDNLQNALIPNLPNHTDPPAGWNRDVGTTRNNATTIIGYLGQLIHAIEEFVDNDQLHPPHIGGHGHHGARRVEEEAERIEEE